MAGFARVKDIECCLTVTLSFDLHDGGGAVSRLRQVVQFRLQEDALQKSLSICGIVQLLCSVEATGGQASSQRVCCVTLPQAQPLSDDYWLPSLLVPSKTAAWTRRCARGCAGLQGILAITSQSRNEQGDTQEHRKEPEIPKTAMKSIALKGTAPGGAAAHP